MGRLSQTRIDDITKSRKITPWEKQDTEPTNHKNTTTPENKKTQNKTPTLNITAPKTTKRDSKAIEKYKKQKETSVHGNTKDSGGETYNWEEN